MGVSAVDSPVAACGGTVLDLGGGGGGNGPSGAAEAGGGGAGNAVSVDATGVPAASATREVPPEIPTTSAKPRRTVRLPWRAQRGVPILRARRALTRRLSTVGSIGPRAQRKPIG